MKEYETMKIYGKTLNTWKHIVTSPTTGRESERTAQVELAYKTFNNEGEIVGVGSEDFTIARMDSALSYYEVWTWDGEKLNRGGNRWFECVRRVQINRADLKKLRHLAKVWYPEAAAIDIRKR